MAKRSRRRQKRAAQLAARKQDDASRKRGHPPVADAGAAPDQTPRPRIRLPSINARRGLSAAAAAVAIAGALIITLGGGGGSAAGLVDLPNYLNPGDQPVQVREGSLAPDFELDNRDDSTFRLSDWRGHPVLLNFWASWCGPCRDEMPAIVALEAQFRDRGLKVVGVNIEESDSAADGFINEFSMRFDVPMDRGGDVTNRYILTGPPHTFFIDPQGVIRVAFRGGAPGAAFQDQVVSLMDALEAPLDSRIAPGLKAVPTALLNGDARVSGVPGDVAPDFVLARRDRPSDRLRLTDLRGQPVLLAFEPPGCQDCAAATDAAVQAARDAGLTVLVVSALEDRAADGLLLDWHNDVASAFSALRTQRFIVIDAGGVVQARQQPGDDLSAALAAVVPAP